MRRLLIVKVLKCSAVHCLLDQWGQFIFWEIPKLSGRVGERYNLLWWYLLTAPRTWNIRFSIERFETLMILE